MDAEKHPLKPFLPSGMRILMLGSFPPSQKRWCMDFFYPNFSNDMWRIFGICFHSDINYFVDSDSKVFKKEKIIKELTERGIGIYDTALEVERTKNTASDKDLRVITPTDIKAILKEAPECDTIVTTGEKATEVAAMQFGSGCPKVGCHVEIPFEERNITHYRMPSSSRAYPMKIERKAECYARMFKETLVLHTTTQELHNKK